MPVYISTSQVVDVALSPVHTRLVRKRVIPGGMKCLWMRLQMEASQTLATSREKQVVCMYSPWMLNPGHQNPCAL